jgi:hypothetical protein
MDIVKRLSVGVAALVGGFVIMFILWQMFTGKSIQFDVTDWAFLVFWLFFSIPVYAYLSKKFLRKPRRYRSPNA